METAVWSALADPNRRAILDLLLTGPRPVGELAETCGLSQPGTSKHLRVLRDAGLVRVERDAQRRLYAVQPAPMAELDAWLAPYRRLWNTSLDALGRRLDAVSPDPGEAPGAPPSGTRRPTGEDAAPRVPAQHDDPARKGTDPP